MPSLDQPPPPTCSSSSYSLGPQQHPSKVVSSALRRLAPLSWDQYTLVFPCDLFLDTWAGGRAQSEPARRRPPAPAATRRVGRGSEESSGDFWLALALSRFLGSALAGEEPCFIAPGTGPGLRHGTGEGSHVDTAVFSRFIAPGTGPGLRRGTGEGSPVDTAVCCRVNASALGGDALPTSCRSIVSPREIFVLREQPSYVATDYDLRVDVYDTRILVRYCTHCGRAAFVEHRPHRHRESLSVCKVPGFQNHRPRAIPHRHSTWVHECEIQVYGIPVQMIPGLWNEIIGY